jgi:hypothetical protein
MGCDKSEIIIITKVVLTFFVLFYLSVLTTKAKIKVWSVIWSCEGVYDESL